MFYGQCWKCKQRWELGTFPTCVCSEPVACKTLCELCIKRGYTFCANAAKTTPITTPPQLEPVDYEKLAALGWQAVECPNCGFSAQAFPKQEPEVDLRTRWPMNKWKENKSAPPQREWVGLTEQEALDCFSPNPVTHSKNVEDKLREKNT